MQIFLNDFTFVIICVLTFQLQIPFRDADEFHTSENKRKMASGIPLTDEV